MSRDEMPPWLEGPPLDDYDAPAQGAQDEPLTRGDEVEVAERALAEHIGEHAVCDRGALHIYDTDSRCWEPHETRALTPLVTRYAGSDIYGGRNDDGSAKVRALKVSHSFAIGAVKIMEDHRRQLGWFDARPLGAGFRDRFVAADGSQRAIGPDLRLLAEDVLPYDYRPCDPLDLAARAPRWTRFLAEVWHGCDDWPERVQCLHEYLGATMLGTVTRHERAIVLYGESAGNGKSTIMSAIAELFAAGARCCVPPADIGQQFKDGALATARVNLVNDMPDHDIVDTGAWKAAISGDAITFHRKYRDPMLVRPRAGHIYATNTLPRVRDKTRGFWRRVVVMDFPHTFDDSPARDAHLARKLVAEREAIAGACIAAALAAGDSLTVPPSSEAVTARWRDSNDHLREFAADLEVVESHNGTDGRTLYRAYSAWCSECGYKPPGRNGFYRQLEAMGFRRAGGARRDWLLAPVRGSDIAAHFSRQGGF